MRRPAASARRRSRSRGRSTRRVVAAAGSAEKLDLCRELGAAEAYLYDEIPDDLRVDVVVDPVGGELFEAAIARLKPLGQLVAIGYAGGMWPELQPAKHRRPQRRRPGRLPRPAPATCARRRRRRDARAARAVERTPDSTVRRRRVPARGGRAGARARRVAPQRRQGRAHPVRALVTGGRGGIGTRDLRAARRSARPRPAGVRRRRSRGVAGARGRVRRRVPQRRDRDRLPGRGGAAHGRVPADRRRQPRRRRLRDTRVGAEADAQGRLDRRDRLARRPHRHAVRSRVHRDEACGHRLGARRSARAR